MGEKSEIQSCAVVIYSGIPIFRTTLGKVRLIGWLEKKTVKGLKNQDSTVCIYFVVPRFLVSRGRKRGRKSVLVILTDGISQDNVVQPARSLKRKGIELFSLGIGNKFRRLQLQQMASSSSHVMTAGFRKLSTVLAALKHRVCMPFVPRECFFITTVKKGQAYPPQNSINSSLHTCMRHKQ